MYILVRHNIGYRTRSKIRGTFVFHDPEKIITQRDFIRFCSGFLQKDDYML